MSAKITTKNKLYFRYGHIKMIVKLPVGDWIVSGKYFNTSVYAYIFSSYSNTFSCLSLPLSHTSTVSY